MAPQRGMWDHSTTVAYIISLARQVNKGLKRGSRFTKGADQAILAAMLIARPDLKDLNTRKIGKRRGEMLRKRRMSTWEHKTWAKLMQQEKPEILDLFRQVIKATATTILVMPAGVDFYEGGTVVEEKVTLRNQTSEDSDGDGDQGGDDEGGDDEDGGDDDEGGDSDDDEDDDGNEGAASTAIAAMNRNGTSDSSDSNSFDIGQTRAYNPPTSRLPHANPRALHDLTTPPGFAAPPALHAAPISHSASPVVLQPRSEVQMTSSFEQSRMQDSPMRPTYNNKSWYHAPRLPEESPPPLQPNLRRRSSSKAPSRIFSGLGAPPFFQTTSTANGIASPGHRHQTTSLSQPPLSQNPLLFRQHSAAGFGTYVPEGDADDVHEPFTPVDPDIQPGGRFAEWLPRISEEGGEDALDGF
ncbi:MAG: hypothetical protein MMC33_010767 [Icmadophila ericetorum]|nr:hypothetical protein [Icmadophila ericetorum]